MVKQLLYSASKIVFMMIALATCVALFTGKMSESNFIILANAAFVYYFSKKGATDIVGEGK